ncbi:dicarboxylate/amino acid:cation symporter [Aliidiomarina maris]|uniref:Dicarboxylate/amino acid:cation symporter n=1 Tax=Aliidiomarina maris TaxID=531312 RepID=A0A327X1I9_9GAMM|nr:dicarboxylate/amino acid:cation symporter [Aliidiomarina maris]MBA3988401.1 dicarboxylate/amino acid:cation symporter [Idiomarina sp.]MCL5049711.1 dicarboxylate/amino acid:cation symporter [Bacillota bacterium]RAJ99078.1 Na+/H+-dicarboxylate symporter [Aliidiomarina maris]RUO27760.1 dicarboxylate/amino acid:cation symporter [Aliidiomarina maris]
MKLILKLIAGIAGGVLIGLFAPEWINRILLTFQGLFSELLTFTIPLLIFFFITSGIANLPQNSANLLGRTLAIAYGSTVIAGTIAYFITAAIVPGLSAVGGASGEVGSHNVLPFLTLEIPPLFGVMSALAAAFIFGLGMTALRAKMLHQAADEGRDIIEKLLTKVIIPLLPIYIAGVFADLALSGTVFSTLQTFGVILLLAVAMHWLWLTIMFVVTGLATGQSPIALLKNMLPAYFTALGTMSSAATIPVTLQATRSNGVSKRIADFTIPLCATTHLSGSIITITTCAIAVMAMREGLSIPAFTEVLPFILMLGVVMLAAPGVPGGAVMSALGLLTSMLGFGEAAVALMIALYMAQDSLGTACNVTGDGAISLWVDKFAKDAKAD